MKNLLVVLAAAVLALAPPALAAPKQGDVIIRHVTLIDVEAAKAVAGQAVVLKGGDIVASVPMPRSPRTGTRRSGSRARASSSSPGFGTCMFILAAGPN